MPIKDCDQFKNELSNFAEGEIDSNKREILQNHLNSCIQCSRKVLHFKKLQKTLRNLPSLKVSPDFDTVLRARIRLEQQRRLRSNILSFPLVGWRFPAFATVVILLFAVSLFYFTKLNRFDSTTSKRIVLTPIPNPQVDTIKESKSTIKPSVSDTKINYVMDQVTLEDLLKNHKGVSLSSDGLAGLERTTSDTSQQRVRRTFSSAQYASHRRVGVRF